MNLSLRLLALATVLACASLAAAALPPAERYLPDDTLAFVTTRDAREARAAFLSTPQIRAWYDPAMKPFRDTFFTKAATEWAGPLEKDLGLSVSNCLALAQGQVTMALTQNGWRGHDDVPPAWVTVMDVGTNSGVLTTNLAEAKKKWVEAGRKFKTETVRGVEFTAYLLATNQIPPALRKVVPGKATPEFAEDKEPATEPTAKTEASMELYLGQSGSLLLAGDSAKVLERVLANIAGDGSATVADQASFTACLPVQREATVFGWVNAKVFISLVNAELMAKAGDPDAPSPLPFRPERLLGALGVNGLKALAVALRPAADRFTAELFIAAPDSERTGLFQLLAGKPGEATFPEFIPADAIRVKRWRFGGRQAWETLEKALVQVSPQLMMGVDFLFAQAGGEEGGLKKKLMDSLGDDLIQYQKAPRGKSAAELAAPPTMLLVASPQPEKLVAALRPLVSLYNRRGEPAKEREFLGRKVYSVELPPTRLRDGTEIANRKLSFTASAGYIALTLDDAMLEEFLRAGDSPGKALRDTPGLADALGRAAPGGSASLMIYANERERMRADFATYKALAALKGKAGAAKPAAKFGSPEASPDTEAEDGGDADKEWFDYSLLPEFDTIAKYFHFEVVVLNVNDTGLTFRLLDPAPPGLEVPAAPAP